VKYLVSIYISKFLYQNYAESFNILPEAKSWSLKHTIIQLNVLASEMLFGLEAVNILSNVYN
jgi:hypothetical protein